MDFEDNLNGKIRKLFEPVVFAESSLNDCFYRIILHSASENIANSKFEDTGLVINLGVICKWPDLVENLLHELFESFLQKEGCRYANTKLPLEYNIFTCIFVLDHTEFQLGCKYVSEKIVEMLPKLYETYLELNELYHKEAEKNEKPAKKTSSGIRKKKKINR